MPPLDLQCTKPCIGCLPFFKGGPKAHLWLLPGLQIQVCILWALEFHSPSARPCSHHCCWEHTQGASHRVRGFVWVRHTEHWGHPCTRWRICRWGIPSGFRAGFLNVVSRLCAPLTPSEGATCHSPSLPASQSCSSCFSTLDVGREKGVPLAASCEPRVTSSHFPWEKSQAEISLGPKLCPPGGRDGASQDKLFLSSSQCFQTSRFFCSKGVLELLIWKPGLVQRLYGLWVIVLDSVFQGLLDQGQGALEPVHRLLHGPQPGPRSLSLLADSRGSKDPLRSLGIWCWIPQLPKRYFCLCLDAKLCPWGRNKGCLIPPWGSCYPSRVCWSNLHFLESVHFLSPQFLLRDLLDHVLCQFFLGDDGIFFLLKFFI